MSWHILRACFIWDKVFWMQDFLFGNYGEFVAAKLKPNDANLDRLYTNLKQAPMNKD